MRLSNQQLHAIKDFVLRTSQAKLSQEMSAKDLAIAHRTQHLLDIDKKNPSKHRKEMAKLEAEHRAVHVEIEALQKKTYAIYEKIKNVRSIINSEDAKKAPDKVLAELNTEKQALRDSWVGLKNEAETIVLKISLMDNASAIKFLEENGYKL